MNVDLELEDWRREWQSVFVPTPDLRKRVDRQARWLKIALAGDTLVTVVIGGPVAAWAVLSPQTDVIVLAVVTWILIAAGLGFPICILRAGTGGQLRWTPRRLSIF